MMKGYVLGSPYYMSPEQVRRRKEVDHRSDLWSLGVIVFQCLTGRLPFDSQELGELLVAICSEDIPPASQIVPELGPVMDQFLVRALARAPEERFQSAQVFARAFHAAASATGALHALHAAASASGAPHALHAAASAAGARPVLENAAAPPPAGPGAPAGTLAPFGGTLARPPGRGRTVGLPMALLGAAVMLGLILLTAQRSPAPDATPATAGEPAAHSPAATPPAAAPAPAQPASEGSASAQPAPAQPASAGAASAPQGTVDPGAPPATTWDTLDASAPASSSQKPAPRRAPAPTRPRKPEHDPLDHM